MGFLVKTTQNRGVPGMRIGSTMASREKHNYDESKVKTLSSLEHIRLRTGMYIGRTGDGTHYEDGIYILVKEVVDNAVDEFINASSPPILFTPGTAMKHASQFFLDCVEACQRLRRRGILLTGHPEQLPDVLPDDIRHFAYLPFSKVLPRAAALVHHGGIGTTAGAIAAGIPQVIRPTAHDQPDTAARVERLGIGVSLPPGKFTAASLAGKLETLMTSQQVLDRCNTYAQRIDPERSLDDTCRIIEGFAGRQS
jgi:UDP:flavonoid glycosyltransferase YjiC (YdhE family)